jgi:hypothetical protein
MREDHGFLSRWLRSVLLSDLEKETFKRLQILQEAAEFEPDAPDKPPQTKKISNTARTVMVVAWGLSGACLGAGSAMLYGNMSHQTKTSLLPALLQCVSMFKSMLEQKVEEIQRAPKANVVSFRKPSKIEDARKKDPGEAPDGPAAPDPGESCPSDPEAKQ